ncbi:MAG TPA: hypothetical protein V6D17_10420, partial [Candidatus Obscuribacterales bacterium]
LVLSISQSLAQSSQASLPPYLEVLSKARMIEDTKTIIPTAKSDLRTAFNQAAAAGVGIRTDLKWLTENASPAGKIYAAVLIRRLDWNDGNQALVKLRNDKDMVQYKKGSEIVHYTVGEIVEDILSVNSTITLEPDEPEKTR